MVSVQMIHGLVDLKKILKQATVRRNVVLQLIRMLKDSGDEDYQNIDMQDDSRRCDDLADTDDPTVPKCLVSLLGDIDDGEANATDEKHNAEQDKAATPAERVTTTQQLTKRLESLRPNVLLPERDSDAAKHVEASRVGAFAQHGELKLRTGSALVDQFQGDYIPRVFKLTFPWHVGGPDLKNRPRFRRGLDRVLQLCYTSHAMHALGVQVYSGFIM